MTALKAPTGAEHGAVPDAKPEAEEALSEIQYDSNGLVPAIVQEQSSGQVLMMAWMNKQSLHKTLATGRTWFWSRSRGQLWCKGETSGNRQIVRSAYYDCDGDTLLFLVDQQGVGACHTGERSCFFRHLTVAVAPDDTSSVTRALWSATSD